MKNGNSHNAIKDDIMAGLIGEVVCNNPTYTQIKSNNSDNTTINFHFEIISAEMQEKERNNAYKFFKP